jgi:hypothetical protein
MTDKEIKIYHEVGFSPEIATYWYEKFEQYKEGNPELDTETLTFAVYLGTVVLGSMKTLFEGGIPGLAL